MGKLKLVSMLEENKGCLGMILVQLAYAGMAMFSKAAIDRGMNPYIFVVYRQAFATITLAPFAFFLDRFFFLFTYLFHTFLPQIVHHLMFVFYHLLFKGRTLITLCRTP